MQVGRSPDMNIAWTFSNASPIPVSTILFGFRPSSNMTPQEVEYPRSTAMSQTSLSSVNGSVSLVMDLLTCRMAFCTLIRCLILLFVFASFP